MGQSHADGTKFIVDQIDTFPKNKLVILDLGCGVGWTFDKIFNGYKKTNFGIVPTKLLKTFFSPQLSPILTSS